MFVDIRKVVDVEMLCRFGWRKWLRIEFGLRGRAAESALVGIAHAWGLQL
jgi:hypothetical protein